MLDLPELFGPNSTVSGAICTWPVFRQALKLPTRRRVSTARVLPKLRTYTSERQPAVGVTLPVAAVDTKLSPKTWRHPIRNRRSGLAEKPFQNVTSVLLEPRPMRDLGLGYRLRRRAIRRRPLNEKA